MKDRERATDNPSPQSEASPNRARLYWLAGGTGSAIAVIVVALLVLVPTFHSNYTGPSQFAPADGPLKVQPGTAGCPEVTGLVCYSVAIESLLHGLSLGSLGFRVANLTTQPGLNTTQVQLGSSARVSALGTSGITVGTWWFSNRTWSSGSTWQVPLNTEVWFVLDTQLVSNSTLSRAWFAIDLGTPFSGGVAFSLFGSVASEGPGA
jgi:hypothetical protein